MWGSSLDWTLKLRICAYACLCNNAIPINYLLSINQLIATNYHRHLECQCPQFHQHPLTVNSNRIRQFSKQLHDLLVVLLLTVYTNVLERTVCRSHRVDFWAPKSWLQANTLSSLRESKCWCLHSQWQQRLLLLVHTPVPRRYACCNHASIERESYRVATKYTPLHYPCSDDEL